jgi:paraquat-inducible protein B
LSQELAALKSSGGIKTEQNGILPQVDNHVMESQNTHLIENLKAELAAKDARIVELSDAYVWVEQAKAMNDKWQTEVATLQGWLQQWQNFHIEQLPNPYDTYCQQLTAECRNYESQLAQGWSSYEQLTAQFAAQTKELESCRIQVADLQRQLTYAQKSQQFSPEKHSSGDEKYEKLFKEHDDLLLLLAEQDSKMKHYKRRLKEHGEAVSDNETDA